MNTSIERATKYPSSWQGNYIEKSAFMVLDLISTNNWKHPIYFNMTSLNKIALDLNNHVLQEGMIYRLLPIELEVDGAVDVEKMYSNMMAKWEFHDLDNDEIYYNHEDYQLRILQTTKSCYNTLARALIEEGKKELAIDVLYADFLKTNIEVDISLVSTTELLFEVKESEKALILAHRLFKNSDKQLSYLRLKNDVNSMEGQIQLFILRQLSDFGIKYDQPYLSKKCANKFSEFPALQ